MKLIIVGAKGMLGRDLIEICGRESIEVCQFDLPEVDISKGDLAALAGCGAAGWLVNCAAYTDVDGAEANRELAFAVNATGARNLAKWCRLNSIRMLHLSTDYVFDGAGSAPYTEEDRTAPLNAYGESKLAGEVAVREEVSDALVVRTQSLFGVHGRNFVRAIMDRLSKTNDPLKVVIDQVSSPTWTVHLAEAMLQLIRLNRFGTVHVSSSGGCSWFDFAKAIADRVKPGAAVLPTSAAEYKRAARRPAYSVLDKSRFEKWTGRAMPSWRDALDGYLAHLKRLKLDV